MTSRLLALAALVLGTLAACAAPGGPAGSNSESLPLGRTFLSMSVQAQGEPKPLVEGTRIILSFPEAGAVAANAGCNSMSGSARLEDGVLVVGAMAMTEMACPGGRMDQDQWLAEFLAGRPTWRLAGDELTLTLGDVTIELLDREVADPDRPLVGTEWTVDTIIGGGSASSVPEDVPAVLVIDASGSFSATTGCAGGDVSGAASVNGETVTFTVTGTEPCSGEGNALDTAVRAVLNGPVTFEITAASLRLTAPDSTGLGLHADE